MSFFILPTIPYQDNIDKLFNVSYFNMSKKNTNVLINKTLYSYLTSIKEKIDSKLFVWDQYKKITNPYEYIHSHIPNTTQSVCKLNPLSRSFFKMIELVNILHLFEGLPLHCKTFHLAEGPGGFIEATSYIRQCEKDTYYAMTLINDKDQNVPGWKKTKHFLSNNPNVIIEKGIDGTGNLMISDNLKYCYDKYNDTMDFITADGGFDFSSDFNNQEVISGKLLFSQIAFAIAMQKKGGNFVVKFFDIFTKASIDMVYFLSMVYNQVYIVKPNTSRYTNSEKYIVCKDFRIDNRNKIVLKMIDIINSFSANETCFIEKIFSNDIPYYYVNKIEEYNAIIGQQQIEYIFSTLSMINNNKYNHFNEIKNIHIQKCIGWCKKFKLPYNKISNYGMNLFNSQSQSQSHNAFYYKNNTTDKTTENIDEANDIVDVDVNDNDNVEGNLMIDDNNEDDFTDSTSFEPTSFANTNDCDYIPEEIECDTSVV